ncbi:MAG: flagellar hook-length control protein FliK [Lachnospiraceae bacterium]|nr:flagellar hook-length control protein FliK [Lachnospiraceae bacterium]
MDSFLSGFSHNYGGAQIGQGYTGTVSTSGTAGANGSQSADVTQLQPGDTFQGEIASVNGEEVQIQLTNGQYMTARLERDVQVAIGQILNLQVQSNKDNRVVLKPVYDSNSQMLRVGEAALRAAHLAVNDKTLTLVSKLIQNGMSIDKNTLMTFNRLALQNPNADMEHLIQLNKLKLPVNSANLAQLQNYQNMQHKLLEGVKETSDEVLKLYNALTGGQEGQGNQDVLQGALNGQTALENGSKFMEQVLALFSDGDGQGKPAEAGNNTQSSSGQPDSPAALEGKASEQLAAEGGKEQIAANKDVESLGQQGEPVNHDRQSLGQQENSKSDNVQNAQANPSQESSQTDSNAIFSLLKGEKLQALPNKMIALIQEGKLSIKDVRQLLLNSDLGKQLSTEQKAMIFRSEPFQSALKNGLQERWTLTPQDLTQEGKVEEFYQKLMKESSQLSRLMDEAMQTGGQNLSGAQAKAAGNLSENVQFMNQMNQMFSYIQLPLKLGNSQAHGDLYVYTNKKSMARREGMLTAFLHLDMEHLGSLDVSIALQTEKNQVTTKFYLNEDAITLVEEHIGELTEKLLKKGYQCKNMVVEKEEDKTVLEHIEEQAAGGNAVLSYQTFDTRA